MLYPLLQQVKQGKGWLAVSPVAPSLIAPFVTLLNDLPGYLSSTAPERYRRCQCHRPQQDQERVRRQLHRYPELRQRREGRINDDRVTSDARQQITARVAGYCPAHYGRFPKDLGRAPRCRLILGAPHVPAAPLVRVRFTPLL
jgi:hypothetical protein